MTNNFKKYLLLPTLLILLSSFLLVLKPALATEGPNSLKYKAKVVEVISEVEKLREDGSLYIQQDLKLILLGKENNLQEVIYYGISDIEVMSANNYKVGDKVFLDAYLDENKDEVFYIADPVRNNYLLALALIFTVLVILIGRFKGLRALLSLVLSFLVIIKFIIPKILSGSDPFLISLLGALLIMVFIIYLTEGWKRKSHLAILSVLISLSITLVLSLIFVSLLNLTGFAQEETMFLIGVTEMKINFSGLLLAGFVIGAIGVLDDIIVGQIEAVESLKEANPNLPPKKIFSLAYRLGNTHLGAIVNTLFLTYAGAALPLLMLYVLNQTQGLSLERFLSTEVVSTEIVRTLVGSIGVILAMPVATFLGAYYGQRKKEKKEL